MQRYCVLPLIPEGSSSRWGKMRWGKLALNSNTISKLVLKMQVIGFKVDSACLWAENRGKNVCRRFFSCRHSTYVELLRCKQSVKNDQFIKVESTHFIVLSVDTFVSIVNRELKQTWIKILVIPNLLNTASGVQQYRLIIRCFISVSWIKRRSISLTIILLFCFCFFFFLYTPGVANQFLWELESA